MCTDTIHYHVVYIHNYTLKQESSTRLAIILKATTFFKGQTPKLTDSATKVHFAN